MNNLLEYRGYFGAVSYSSEDDCLVGKVLFINDSLNFDGQSIAEIKKHFKETVDDYLSFCARNGTPPDQACKGSFNVRVGPDLHRASVIAAAQAGMNLNEYVKTALQEKLEADSGKASPPANTTARSGRRLLS